jgi:uncharacterized protein YneF (UPF0154 family)
MIISIIIVVFLVYIIGTMYVKGREIDKQIYNEHE